MDDAPQSGTPDPEQARELLGRAEAVGAAATAHASWPALAFLLTLGAATSMGTMSMALTTGAAYVVSLVAMLMWVLVGVAFLVTHARSSKIGFKRRWSTYIALWAVAYGIAVAIASTSEGHNIVGACVASALILIATAGGVWRETRA